MNFKEYNLQKRCCQWLELQHPNILFLSDTIGNVKLTTGQAVRNKAIQKNGFKCPDVIILQPNNRYHGLLIELKKESPFKKDGNLKTNTHLQEQQKSINDLNNKGFLSLFCWDFDDFVKIVNDYITNKNKDEKETN